MELDRFAVRYHSFLLSFVRESLGCFLHGSDAMEGLYRIVNSGREYWIEN